MITHFYFSLKWWSSLFKFNKTGFVIMSHFYFRSFAFLHLKLPLQNHTKFLFVLFLALLFNYIFPQLYFQYLFKYLSPSRDNIQQIVILFDEILQANKNRTVQSYVTKFNKICFFKTTSNKIRRVFIKFKQCRKDFLHLCIRYN